MYLFSFPDTYPVQPWIQWTKWVQHGEWINLLLHFRQLSTSSTRVLSISLLHQLKICYSQMQVKEILHLQNLMIFNYYFIVSEDSFSPCVRNAGSDQSFPVKLKVRCMVMLSLMLSGIDTPPKNATPSVPCSRTPSDLKSRTGLGFTHLNVAWN